MNEATDGQLLKDWRERREPAAFSALVHRHQDALLRQARGLFGAGSVYEDVVQEVFLKLAREDLKLPSEASGDPEAERRQLLGWLHTVTRNACMDAIRSETRRKRREHDAASPDRAEGGLHRVEAEDTRSVVERELQKLPVDQRDVLVLRLLADRSYREIAEITGKKIGTVGWLISEGLKHLSAQLAPLLAMDGAPASGLAAATRPTMGQGTGFGSSGSDRTQGGMA
jgi:RNA polymerase sigma-70 factor, ECF subfamily